MIQLSSFPTKTTPAAVGTPTAVVVGGGGGRRRQQQTVSQRQSCCTGTAFQQPSLVLLVLLPLFFFHFFLFIPFTLSPQQFVGVFVSARLSSTTTSTSIARSTGVTPSSTVRVPFVIIQTNSNIINNNNCNDNNNDNAVIALPICVLCRGGGDEDDQQPEHHPQLQEQEEEEIQEEQENDDESNRKRKHTLKIQQQQQVLADRISKVSSLLLRQEHDAKLSIGKEREQEEVASSSLLLSTTTTEIENSTTSKDEEEDKDDNTDDNNNNDLDNENENKITYQSDLSRPGRYIHIVTTAALPWMTGTAVNPLLRAAYLHDRLELINNQHKNQDHTNTTNTTTTYNNRTSSSYVTVVIPWLELEEDQQQLYNGRIFQSRHEQEHYIRNWLYHDADMKHASEQLNIVFYNARYHTEFGSIFAMGDIIQEIQQTQYQQQLQDGQDNQDDEQDQNNHNDDPEDPDQLFDVCILEEPEHLNFFRAPGTGWTKRYNYVVGIVHTNYDQYATQHYSGIITAPAIRLMSSAMVRAYCHKVIKLSNVVQEFQGVAPEKEIVCNVHGVRQEFLTTSTSTTGGSSMLSSSEEDGEESDETAAATNGTVTNNGDDTDDGSSLSVHDDNDEEGSSIDDDTISSTSRSSTQVYFIGKLLWTKGLDLLLEYEEYYKEITGTYFAIDIYGSGPDQLEIARAYLGRKNNNNGSSNSNSSSSSSSSSSIQSKVEKLSKNMLVTGFAWMNRRRCQKRNKKSDNNNTGDRYQEVIGLIGSLPLKAKDTLENLPFHTQAARDKVDQWAEDATAMREAVDQWTEDITTKARQSMDKLPTKAQQAFQELIADLSMRSSSSLHPLPRSFNEFRRQPIPATFPGRIDHAALNNNNNTSPSQYKIFVNPSLSEVLCTTTAEALAMGKFVIIPVHPSNQFFLQFPNCLGYRNPYEFVANLQWALTHDPTPLTKEVALEFTWEAATDRFLIASSITCREAKKCSTSDENEIGRGVGEGSRSSIDERIAWFHNELGKGVRGDMIRKALGGGPVSGQVQYVEELLATQKNNDNNKHNRQRQRNNVINDETDDVTDIDTEYDDDYDDDGDDEDNLLPRKFRNSVFVRGLREAIENGLKIAI